ncbi:MAG TPA: phosphotransferase [Pseudonocardia sp.]|jgi:hypothetical protein|nr:phosphotransferase [Pseudonocardia sp.]
MGESSENGRAGEPEPPWLEAVERRYGGPVSVVGNRPMSGGYVSSEVRRYELECAGRPVSVVWKRTTAREVAALRAVDAVPGIGGPRLLAHGELAEESASWVLMPHHAGTPLVDGQPVPDAAYEILARVHARYLGEQVPGLPVVDAAFWRRLCLDVALPAVRGAARRSASGGVASGAVAPGVASGGVAPGVASGGVASGDDPGRSDPPERDQKLYGEAEERLLVWSSDDRMLSALSLLPATLAHGDLHRGNIVEGPGGAVIIDWGGARIAPGGLDLAVLAEQGGVDHTRYHRRLAELSGREPTPEMVEVEKQWALAMGYVQYLGFAADCYGADRVGVMVDRAARAFDQLGAALSRA